MKNSLFKNVTKIFSQFFGQDQGVVAIMTGLLFLVFIGFAALAIDVSLWYSERRQLQYAADAGASGGALALQSDKANFRNHAIRDIQLNNSTCAVGGSSCNIVAINNPPTSGASAGSTNAVEVILSKPADMFLAGFFLSSAPTLQVRSVVGTKPSNNCVVALASSGIGINVKGGAAINSPGCGIYANSSASNAINVVGGGSITTNTAISHGGISTSGGGTITGTQATSAPTVADPYAGIQIPSFSGCNQNNFKLTGSSQTINPGVYCGGIKLTGKSTLTMTPGVYFMDQGDFNIAAQATVTGPGVTIIMTSSTGSGYGSVTINGGATITMSAPTTGTTAGILFFGDRNSSGLSEKFNGGASQTFNGALYFPTNDVDYSGQSAGSGNPCFQIVAYTITFTGGGSLGNSCGSPGLGNTNFLE